VRRARSKGSIEVAERSLSGVGEERLRPATRPIHKLKALDAWIDKQEASLTRPEAIRAMMETILHILSKDRGDKPTKKAKAR
jgi:hypothetical protein